MVRIDVNCDMGESPEAIADGTQEQLFRSITSANVACGGHAGDTQTMRTTIEQALRVGAVVGAHPGYPDRANFGRLELKMASEELANSVREQVEALAEIAAACGTRIAHVKPHGALYNQAVKDRGIAEAIAKGVAMAIGHRTMSEKQKLRFARPGGGDRDDKSGRHSGEENFPEGSNEDIILVGLAGSPMLDVFHQAGFRVAAEAFADRRYELDGTLRSRRFDDALIRDPGEAARQALRIAQRGVVTTHTGAEVQLNAQTICVHGDTPGAPKIAAAVCAALREAGVVLASLTSHI